MTRTAGPVRRSSGVRPSSQDPVQRWLDIFVPMTGLSRSRQSEIRAELEDHLRARTSDLMITGLSEPDAIQQAVSELGETAHLARQFRTALKPRRNTPMNIALAAAAGIAVTAGLIAFTGNGAGHLAGHAHAAVAAIHGHDAEHDGAHHDGAHEIPSHPIDNLRGQTYGGLFAAVSGHSDIPILVHWDRLQEIGIDANAPLGLEVDALPSHVLYRLLRERTESVGDPLTVEESPELIEFSLQSHFDRRSIEIRPHSIEGLVGQQTGARQAEGGRGTTGPQPTRRGVEAEGHEVLESVVELVESDAWVPLGGDLASARVVGASLIVSAPVRIHEEIARVIEMMRAEVQRFEDERARAAQRAAQTEAARAEELRAERQARILSLEAAIQENLEHIVALETRKSMLEEEHKWAERSASGMVTSSKETEQQASERAKRDKDRIPSLHAELVRIDIEIRDAMSYRGATQSRLMQLRHEAEPARGGGDSDVAAGRANGEPRR
jgi:hypothetical protein